jgi:hypothetical protein
MNKSILLTLTVYSVVFGVNQNPNKEFATIVRKKYTGIRSDIGTQSRLKLNKVMESINKKDQREARKAVLSLLNLKK